MNAAQFIRQLNKLCKQYDKSVPIEEINRLIEESKHNEQTKKKSPFA